MSMKKNKIIKRVLVLSMIIIITLIVGSIIIKYQVEGETNMPFKVSRIMVISSAQGIQKDESESKWDLQLVQNNDIYIDIAKNKNYQETEVIDKVIVDNFSRDTEPIKGIIKTYRPNDKENGVYVNAEEFLVNEKLEYTGGEKSNIKNLEIANQGGLILLRYVNEGLGQYTSNEEEEIRHDGTLLSKVGIQKEELNFTISFDLSIVLKSKTTYKARVKLEMPVGNVVQEGTSSYEKTDVRDVVFKRE